MKLSRSLAFAFAAALCTSAFPGTTVYSFAGLIDVNNTANPTLAITSFVGQFSFDAATPDDLPLDTHEGLYPMNNGLYGMHVLFNNGTFFDIDPLRYALTVHVPLPVMVGDPPDIGRFDVHGRLVAQTDRFMGIQFRKSFTTDALPFSAGVLDLAFFDEALFSYHGLASPASLPGEPVVPPFGAFGHLTSLSCDSGCGEVGVPPRVVPEPATQALVLAGIGAIGVSLRRRRPLGVIVC